MKILVKSYAYTKKRKGQITYTLFKPLVINTVKAVKVKFDSSSPRIHWLFFCPPFFCLFLPFLHLIIFQLSKLEIQEFEIHELEKEESNLSYES